VLLLPQLSVLLVLDMALLVQDMLVLVLADTPLSQQVLSQQLLSQSLLQKPKYVPPTPIQIKTNMLPSYLLIL